MWMKKRRLEIDSDVRARVYWPAKGQPPQQAMRGSLQCMGAPSDYIQALAHLFNFQIAGSPVGRCVMAEEGQHPGTGEIGRQQGPRDTASRSVVVPMLRDGGSDRRVATASGSQVAAVQRGVPRSLLLTLSLCPRHGATVSWPEITEDHQ